MKIIKATEHKFPFQLIQVVAWAGALPSSLQLIWNTSPCSGTSVQCTFEADVVRIANLVPWPGLWVVFHGYQSHEIRSSLDHYRGQIRRRKMQGPTHEPVGTWQEDGSRMVRRRSVWGWCPLVKILRSASCEMGSIRNVHLRTRRST